MRTRGSPTAWLPDIDLSIAVAQAIHYEAEHRILMRNRSNADLVGGSRPSSAAAGEPLTSRFLACARSALRRLAPTRLIGSEPSALRSLIR